MKATGIVRRIDDLGRVVIPKEIRRTMRIREGDLLLTTLTPIERFCVAIHSVVNIKYPHTLVRQDTFSRAGVFYLSIYNRCEFLLAPCYTCRGIYQP